MNVLVLTAVGLYPPEVVLSQSQTFITQLRAIAGSSDPVAAAESLLTDMLDFALASSPSIADSVLSQVGRLSFNPATETALMADIDSLLAGAMLDVSPSPVGAFRSQRPSPSLGEPTEVVLVNGIWTVSSALTAAVTTATKLFGGLEAPEAVSVRAFYNPSNPLSTGNYDECVRRMAAGGSTREVTAAVIRFCIPLVGGTLDENDLAEATSQILRRLLPPVLIPPRAISLELADTLQSIRDRGPHVTVIGHSQGMLIAREAVQELVFSNRYKQTRDSVCLGAIGLGGPGSGDWGLPINQVDEYAVNHDLVAALSFQPRVTTVLSAELDSANTGASPLKQFVNRISYGMKSHDLVNSYLKDPASVARLLSSVEHIRRECEPGALLPAWTTSPSFYRGDEFVPWLYFTVNNFNGRRLYGRTIAIASTDSTVANVLPNRLVRAVAHGSASILGSSGTLTASLPFVVGPVPNVLPTGSRSGKWSVIYPLTEDSLWVSGLAQVDSVTPLGEFVVTGGTISYRYNGTTYSVPALNARIGSGGTTYQLRFNMATPEFSDPASYATVQLSIQPGGGLIGGATLYMTGGIRETRGWNLVATQP
ncbi:MAG TPA: hypothetical protein VFN22_07270 [Gemmatimonadales bacterium]|nr:hypothetical protein [Gemmatimonadales bacterium]